jgi:crotonobetainyl-CoA:carnitine CoA-transferase CaiB-like acyl-CoA transferase
VSDGPLQGTLVVEFGNLIAAPYAAMLLADLGARVIKVEPPGGDLARAFGPFHNGESAFFMAVNRGKESLALDPKDWLSKRVLDNLVRKADVLVHNLRHGAIDRLGLGEDRARELNPNLIYAAISAFGAEGPYAERPGIDIIFQGESGMISLTGGPRDPTMKTATTIGDYLAGTNTAFAITASLAATPRRWQKLDISLRDGLIAAQATWNALALASGEQPERTGTASPYVAPSQVFEASDEPFTLAVVSDHHFELLANVLDRSDFLRDYPTNDDRMRNQGQLARKLQRIFAQHKAEHWLELLGGAGLPVGSVLTLLEALRDPQARHNQMTVEFHHPVAGTVKTTGSPIHVDGTQARAPSIPATLGQHTRSLLGELGLDPETIEQMVDSGTAVAS